MIKIKMKETEKGSPDGLKVNTYEKGETYEMPEDLANVFVKEMKIATLVKEKRVIKSKPILKLEDIEEGYSKRNFTGGWRGRPETGILKLEDIEEG